MNNVVACYVVANEASSPASRALLSESIRSIKAYVDRAVVIDSIFEANPARGTHSSDETKDLIADLLDARPAVPYKYVESQVRLTEPKARNAYLDLIHADDWVFVIDGDEVLLGNYAETQALFSRLRAAPTFQPELNLGKLDVASALLVPVYTVAVNSNQMAPDIDVHTYAHAPLISTRGMMPRLFRSHRRLRYTVPVGAVTPALSWLNAEGRLDSYLYTSAQVPEGSFFLVNYHTRQSWEDYQNDYIWETGSVAT